MATKAKDSTTPGKELKKSTSALNSHTKPTKKLTKAASTTTLEKTTSSTSTAKQVPNYLKPTLSASRHENSSRSASAGAKKHGSEDSAASQKATLSRRRSFDKPPSPSRLRKSLVSPGRDQTLRSSSFSAKSSNAPRPSSIERTNLKTSRTGKPQLLYEKSVKKGGTSGSGKKESSSGVPPASTRAPKSQDITQTLNLEANLEAIESLDHHEVEEVDKIECEEHDKVVLPDPKVEENEHVEDHVAAVEAEANSGEDEKLKPSENSTVNAEELKENVDERNEESGTTLTREEKPADNDQHEGDEVRENENKLDESSGTQPEEGLATEETKAKVKEEKEKESDKEENAGDESKNVEEKALDLDEKEGEKAVDGGIEEAKSAEAVEAAEAAETSEATTAKPSQASEGSQGGKKDSAPAYNDVIEETASKLLEKRKNKVKALVGAFETVIDYESK